jgi:quinol-cytochrome oxidoreductase complex cytochrome b subunit
MIIFIIFPLIVLFFCALAMFGEKPPIGPIHPNDDTDYAGRDRFHKQMTVFYLMIVICLAAWMFFLTPR